MLLFVLLPQVDVTGEGEGEGEEHGIFYAEVQLEAEVLELMAESFSDCSLESLQVSKWCIEGDGGRGWRLLRSYAFSSLILSFTRAGAHRGMFVRYFYL